MDFVIDASVVLTWCFHDEHSSEAARLLDLIRTPGNRAMVPAFFHQEVLNALLMGERRNRITAAATAEFMADLLALPFAPAMPDTTLIGSIEALSRKHGLTAYDATYLELALRFKVPLASFDNALVRGRDAESVKPA